MGLFRDNNHNMSVGFKERKPFAARKEEALNIRSKFPTKVPVIVQRGSKEKYLPALDKTKFLVPQDLTMSQFVTVIRNRMAIGSSQAFFLLINGKSMASMTRTLSEVYQEYKDLDGFLYVTYSSEETFGSDDLMAERVPCLDPHEVSLAAARAAVMVYDDTNKKWIPSGSSSGLSKVHVYHHTINNTFRVVGRKLQDHEVVINCALLKGLKYNQATPTFHQWRDSKQVYGLNFSSKDDADAFAAAMLRAIEVINGHVVRPAPTPPAPTIPQFSTNNQYANQNNHQQQQQQQNVYQSVNNGCEEDTYRSREEVTTTSVERRSSQSSLGSLNHSVSTPTIQQQTPQPTMSPPQSSTGGHHRANSAPNPPHQLSQAPQPPPLPPGGPGSLSQGPPPPPPAPPQFGGSPMAPPPQFANTGGNSPPITSGPPSAPSGGPPEPPPMPGGVSKASPPSGGPPPPPPMNNSAPPAPPMGPPVAPPMMGSGPPMAPPMMGSGPPMAPPMMGSGPPTAPPMMGGGPAIGPPMMGGGPPPPPPMMPLLSRQNSGMDSNSLVNALQNVRLKKNAKSIDSGASSSSTVESIDSGASSSSSSSAGSTYGTIGKGSSERASLSGAGMGSMMDEMQKTLARRRAQAERQDTTASSQDESDHRKYNTISTSNGRLNNGNSESPKISRKRQGSSGDESPRVNGKQDGGSLDLESFKQEIIKEVRNEIQKAKQEIIDAIRIELSRR